MNKLSELIDKITRRDDTDCQIDKLAKAAQIMETWLVAISDPTEEKGACYSPTACIALEEAYMALEDA